MCLNTLESVSYKKRPHTIEKKKKRTRKCHIRKITRFLKKTIPKIIKFQDFDKHT